MTDTHHLFRKILIVAGEASGDQHGAALVRALLKKDCNLQFFGIGGQELERVGVSIFFNAGKIAVVGLSEVLTHLMDIFSAFSRLKKELDRQRPDLVIVVDFADFNLRVAKEAYKRGIPVFYYITPKVWVWRKNRVKKLAKFVNRAGVILPFEENYLRDRGVDAQYVGNPALDSVKTLFDRAVFCGKYSLDENKTIVGILPGSRRKEVSTLLPVFLQAARRMQQKYNDKLVFVIPLASTLEEADLLENGLREARDEMVVHVLPEDRYELMAACDAVMAASGTVTLELALLDVPMVVAYRFSPLTYLVGKLFINIPHFSLVNIIAGKEVAKELLQGQVTPEALEHILSELLFDANIRSKIKKELHLVRRRLGEPGASENAATIAVDIMDKVTADVKRDGRWRQKG